MRRAFVLIVIATTATFSASLHKSQRVTGLVPARDAMISVLGAANPNASLGDEAREFDRLIGAWDADFGFYRDGSPMSHKKGELLFGWVLDGRALQDLWIVAPSDSGKDRTIGTTIWFFDTARRQWRIVFVGPQYRAVVTAQGGRDGDRIVLRGVDKEGLPFRWTFRDITAKAFRWQGERSHDGGKTWKLEEENHLTRRQTEAAK